MLDIFRKWLGDKIPEDEKKKVIEIIEMLDDAVKNIKNEIAVNDENSQCFIDNNLKDVETAFLELKKYKDYEVDQIFKAFCKRYFKGCFTILDSEPFIDEQARIRYTRNSTNEETVNHIVQKIRWGIFTEDVIDRDTGEYGRMTFNVATDELANMDRNLSKKIYFLCKKMGLKADVFDINSLLENAATNNFFVLVEINDEKYIIDCAYRQYFSVLNLSILMSDNDNKKTNISETMRSDEKKEHLAKHLLKYGWIKATPENIKMYLDGFIQYGEYSEEEYLKFIEGATPIEWPFPKLIGNKGYELEGCDENKFLINSEPITDGLGEEEYDDRWTDEQKLNAIVRRERMRLSKLVGKDGKPYNIKSDSLKLDCVYSTDFIRADCGEKKIKCMRVHNSDLIKRIYSHLQHFFCCAELGGKNYIIDCTYRQFFITADNEKQDVHYPRKIYDNG